MLSKFYDAAGNEIAPPIIPPIGSTDQLQTAALTSIARSLDSLLKLAARLEPLLVRLEEELAKDDIHDYATRETIADLRDHQS